MVPRDSGNSSLSSVPAGVQGWSTSTWPGTPMDMTIVDNLALNNTFLYYILVLPTGTTMEE
ncbi:uncharacterized protein N7487_010427 [Penicillium crustosum]|uniref:uncharacterized protein n=1 Tax=Penicillium crustosum TaxID=36656 RepID=UPI00239C9966|nr:uncharacterized protein N7487_010427 [Penicillium crustosum]KAJ5396124.1 hypothetical protein N7487_010427 [Penicillium crustosum]